MAATHTGTNASKPPISQHPAFPAIVALWFAALLGIGSFVLPVSLFEGLVVATGLPTVISAAEPPLGVAARILIALAGAGLGVVTGLFIARKVAAAQNAGRPATRPISAHEELGAESFDEPVDDMRAAPIRGRRRALAMTEESGPSELLDYAPLPGADARVTMAPDEADGPAEPGNDALDLAAFADPAESPEPIAEWRESQPNHAFPPELDEAPAIAAMPDTSLAADELRPFDAPEFVSPIESEAQEAKTPAPFADTPVELGVAEEEQAAPAPAPVSELDIPDERPLAELSITELVGRFALSLQRATERAEADLPPTAAPARYVPDLGVEAVEAPRFTAPPEAMPAALRPLALDDEPAEDDEDDLSLTLSLSREARPFSQPPAAPVHIADEDDEAEREEAPVEGAYSSLLNIRKPESPREFVRIEDDEDDGDSDSDTAIEPVVVFPGHEERRAAPASDGPAREPVAQFISPGRPFDAPSGLRAAPPASDAPPVDQGQAERALREALHKLQRLSGAA